MINQSWFESRLRGNPECRAKLWWMIIGAAFVVSLLVSIYVYSYKQPLNLGVPGRLLTTGTLQAWQNGDLVVLVRHEERCDRSYNPCVGPPDGITIAGSLAAVDTGRAFKILGIENTDVVASQSTRATQTLQFMFGEPGQSLPRETICGNQMSEKILSLKAFKRNLLQLTHSGCINQLEKELGFPHVVKAGYGSALFVFVEPSNNSLKILGIMNAQDWGKALALPPMP